MDIRPATPDDRDELFELHRLAFEHHIEAIWGWDERWQQANFASELASCRTRVVREDGRLVGYLQLRDEPHRLYLQNIALRPEHRNKGIGSALLESAKAEATSLRVPLHLSVFLTNGLAERFYRRHGFARTGETSTHVEMAWNAGQREA